MFVKMVPIGKKCAKLCIPPAGANNKTAGANFPQITLLLGGGRQNSDAGDAYI
jgi:hypothetical protein